MSGSALQIRVDERTCDVEPEDTILDAVQAAGEDLPVLCHDPRLSPQGSCGVCVVEVRRGAHWVSVPACATRVAPGMVVRTRSEAVDRSRRWTLELLFSQHTSRAKYHELRGESGKAPLVCACHGQASCQLRELCVRLDARANALGVQGAPGPTQLLRPGLELEMSKCVHCDRCVRICREVASVEALGFAGRGTASTLLYAAPVNPEALRACDECLEGGALCIDTCPTDALHAPRSKKKGG